MFKLAMIQMKVVGGAIDENLDRAVKQIDLAAKQGAEVVLLPEVMDVGWTHPAARELAGTIEGGRSAKVLKEAAKSNGVYVCSGLSERDGDEIYNAAVLIDPQGEIIGHHRKLNELTIAHDVYGQGDRLAVAKTPLATFGLMICADGFATGQVIGRTLGYMGADVILSPCAWAVPADWDNEKTPYGDLWRANYPHVAKDYSMWIASVSNVGRLNAGPWEGQLCIGCSMVFGPDGEQVLQGPFGEDAETILYVDVEPVERPERGLGWDPKFRKCK